MPHYCCVRAGCRMYRYLLLSPNLTLLSFMAAVANNAALFQHQNHASSVGHLLHSFRRYSAFDRACCTSYATI